MREYYDGKEHYLIYGAETAYQTGSVVTTNTVGKLDGVNISMNNNLIPAQGVGEGANATAMNYGNFEVTGSLSIKPTQFHYLQFGSGTITGSGSTANPYQLLEGDNIGYSGTSIRTATFEIGAKGQSNHQAMTIQGVSFNSWTLSGNQGEELTSSVDFITSGSVTRSTTLNTVTGDGRSTFVFSSGSVSWNNEELSCSNFSVTSNHPSNYPREVFSRFGKQPTKGVRRYNWTLTVNKHYDDASGVISGNELLTEFFGATNTPKTDGTPTGRDLLITIQDGTSSGDKVAIIQLENSFINDWAENPTLEGGVVSITVNGNSLAGKTTNGEKVPLQWYDRT